MRTQKYKFLAHHFTLKFQHKVQKVIGNVDMFPLLTWLGNYLIIKLNVRSLSRLCWIIVAKTSINGSVVK